MRKLGGGEAVAKNAKSKISHAKILSLSEHIKVGKLPQFATGLGNYLDQSKSPRAEYSTCSTNIFEQRTNSQL
jgi:hypothetical protein